MTKRRFESLRFRLIWPFALLGLVVSAILSIASYLIVTHLETQSIERMLQVEVESFRNRKALYSEALPPAASSLTGFLLPDPAFPEIDGSDPATENVEYFTRDGKRFAFMTVMVDDMPYALVYDFHYVDDWLRRLPLILLVATLAMTLLSFAVGNWLAQAVVRPIWRLLDEITTQAGRVDLLKEAPPPFFASDTPDNEIGNLAKALDGFAFRLYGFVKRESYFSSDVSHELRTPIAVIRGAAELLMETDELPPVARQRVLSIYRHALRMSEMLEAMLLLAKESEDRGDPQCSLAAVIDDVVVDCEPLLSGRPINLRVDIQERIKLPVERSLAYVVLSNLVRNAASYTREGEIVISLYPDRLEVVDTGIGIPEARFVEIFKRHAKGVESSGAGIGLSIVDRIAQMLNWRLEVESESGKGTRVLVTFPPPVT